MSLHSMERPAAYQGRYVETDRVFSLFGSPADANEKMLNSLAQRDYHYSASASVSLLFDTPIGFGLHALENATRAQLACTHKLIIITQNTCPEYWDDLNDFHPSVIVLESELDQKLDLAFRTTQRSERYRSVPQACSHLTHTERRVLRLLGCGYSNPQIADEVGVQHKTIRNALTTIYEKLGVASRTDALLYYWGTWQGFARALR